MDLYMEAKIRHQERLNEANISRLLKSAHERSEFYLRRVMEPVHLPARRPHGSVGHQAADAMQIEEKMGQSHGRKTRKQSKETQDLTVLSSKPPGYYSYILRCWVEPGPRENGAAICRYSLEDPHTGERFTFPGLESLTDFLQARAANSGGCPIPPATGG